MFQNMKNNNTQNSGIPLAMPIMPVQQWSQPYDLPTALREGTVFPELNKPFYMGGREYGR